MLELIVLRTGFDKTCNINDEIKILKHGILFSSSTMLELAIHTPFKIYFEVH